MELAIFLRFYFSPISMLHSIRSSQKSLGTGCRQGVHIQIIAASRRIQDKRKNGFSGCYSQYTYHSLYFHQRQPSVIIDFDLLIVRKCTHTQTTFTMHNRNVEEETHRFTADTVILNFLPHLLNYLFLLKLAHYQRILGTLEPNFANLPTSRYTHKGRKLLPIRSVSLQREN